MNKYNYWLENADELREELEGIYGDVNEIEARFAVPLAFGTGGMRGILGAGEGRLNVYSVRRATKGLAEFIKSDGGSKKGVVISYDTRKMSFEFALEAAKVLSEEKIAVFLFEDVRPISFCSFAVRNLGAAAGIMITASHNPKEYNGYKIFGQDGAQMSLDETQKVIAEIDKTGYFNIKLTKLKTENRADVIGKDNKKLSRFVTVIGKSIDEKYFAEIEKLCLSRDEIAAARDNLKIVYTPLHGAGRMSVTHVLDSLKIPFSVVSEQVMPDGNFPTVSTPNPEQPDALKLGIQLAEEIGADIVMGTDPDCDRLGVAVRDLDGKFTVLSGNQAGAVMLDYLLVRKKELGALPANAGVVKTIVTTGLADKIAANYGADCVSVLTGFKFIGEKIKEWEETGSHSFVFGYEESFGYLEGTHSRDKDAVVASMLFAEAACYFKTKDLTIYEKLQELYEKYGYFSEKSDSFVFNGVFAMQEMSAMMDNLRKTEIKNIGGKNVEAVFDYKMDVNTNLPKSDVIKYFLEGGTWVAVRPSGTEPKMKVYVSAEGTSMPEAEKLSSEIIVDLHQQLFGKTKVKVKNKLRGY